MNRFLTCVSLIFLNGTFLLAVAQTVTVENSLRTVVLTYPGKPIPLSERRAFSMAPNYKLYELVDPKGVGIHARALDDIVAEQVTVLLEGERLRVQFNAGLQYGKIYLLKIENASINGSTPPVTRIELGAEPSVKVYSDPRQKVRVQSNVELSESGVSVTEVVPSISDSKSSLVFESSQVDVETTKVTPTQLDLNFKKKLSEARNHYFKIQVAAADGARLRADTKVSIPGLPAANPDPSIDLKLSSEFGSRIGPQFNFAGVLTRQWFGSETSFFFLKPALSVDVGLGATISKNAILLSLPFMRRTLNFRTPAGCTVTKPPVLRGDASSGDDLEFRLTTAAGHREISLPCYAEWGRRNPLSLYSIDFVAGPKFEMDKKFARVNVVGQARIDFNFDRWQHSIARQRSYIEIDLRGQKGYEDVYKDVYVKSGFTITPHIGVEFGRKLTAQVVENDSNTIRYVIPQYPILRTFAGVSAVFEWNYRFLPLTVSLSEDLIHLGRTETIGEIKDALLNVRRLRGFHPYGKLSFDFFMDPAKRYSFNVTYENGRSAPNFEYLNTVKTGIRILY
jgi:hypothetical protein